MAASSMDESDEKENMTSPIKLALTFSTAGAAGRFAIVLHRQTKAGPVNEGWQKQRRQQQKQ